MKYLSKSFSVAMPGRSPMACERCVWGRGRHAIFCESELPSARLDVIDAITEQAEKEYQFVGIKMRCDPGMDYAAVQIRDSDGRVLAEAVNVGLPCGHPRSSLYFGKYALEEGECMDCGEEYARRLRAESVVDTTEDSEKSV